MLGLSTLYNKSSINNSYGLDNCIMKTIILEKEIVKNDI